MKVIIRSCPEPTNKPLPLGYDKKSKEELVSDCYKSFQKANTRNSKVWVINDGWENPEELFPKATIVEASSSGNVATFHEQIDFACSLDDVVLLLEDDYLWRPDTLPALEDACWELDFVSPYDHPGHYTEERFAGDYHHYFINNYVFRNAPSNTLTFACHSSKIINNISKFKSYGVADHEMWTDIGNMYVPHASFATHMVEGLLAPNFEWGMFANLINV